MCLDEEFRADERVIDAMCKILFNIDLQSRAAVCLRVFGGWMKEFSSSWLVEQELWLMESFPDTV